MTSRRGRPLGFVSRSIVEALQAQPRTLRELSEHLRLSYPHAKQTVLNLAERGLVRSAGQVPTATRPATVYAPAEPQQRAADLHFVMGMMVRGGRR